MRKNHRGRLIALTVFLGLGAAWIGRTVVLTWIGRTLISTDALRAVDEIVITPNSGDAGGLEAADAFTHGLANRVAVLVPAQRPDETELSRRGIARRNRSTAIVVDLGVPQSSIDTIAAGEGDTTACAEALSRWADEQHVLNVAVVVGPMQSGRFRRELRRNWRGAGFPLIVVPRSSVSAGDWWRSLRMRRDGIAELQLLLFDWITHPF